MRMAIHGESCGSLPPKKNALPPKKAIFFLYPLKDQVPDLNYFKSQGKKIFKCQFKLSL